MVSKTFKTTFGELFLVVGLTALAVWPFRKSKTEAAPSVGTAFAFVNKSSGEPIYKTPGETQIDRLENNTYAGVLTGNENGNYVEVVTSTEEDQLPLFFWVAKSGISVVAGKEEASKKLDAGAKEKSTSTLNKIISANA